MTTSRRRARGAFTLVELLVAAGLSGLVLAGVLATSVELMRSSLRLSNYAEMNAQVRRAFAQLDVDLKAASNLVWNGTSDITVTVPKSDGTTGQFTYAWSSSTLSFFRVPGASSASQSGRVELIKGIPALANGSPGLSFARLDASGNATSTDLATKQIQVALTVSRTAGAAPKSTSSVTATFTLRNKRTS